MKVLLFSSELMPVQGVPPTVAGVRALQLCRGLEAAGMEVVVSSPRDTSLAMAYLQDQPKELRELCWSRRNQEKLIAEHKPDAVLFSCGWEHVHLASKPDIPLVLDLYSPRLVRANITGIPVAVERKLLALSRADCIVVGSERERLYTCGWLVQAGRVPEDRSFIVSVPPSVIGAVERLAPSADIRPDGPRLVADAQNYPWHDQSLAVAAAYEELERMGKGELLLTERPWAAHELRPIEQKLLSDWHPVAPALPSDERLSRPVLQAEDLEAQLSILGDVALVAPLANLYQHLTVDFQTVHYLARGMPVIASAGTAISSVIREYEAGWVVHPEREEEVRAVVRRISLRPELVSVKRDNALRLVREQLGLEQALQPLVSFLEKPRVVSESEPVLGSVCARPAFLTSAGKTVSIPLTKNDSTLEQRFIVPAENLSRVELPIVVDRKRVEESVREVELQLRKPNGRLVCRQRVDAEALPVEGKLGVEFPTVFKPAGGEEMVFSMHFVPRGNGNGADPDSPIISVAGQNACEYPFIAQEAGNDGPASLQLEFVPGEYSTVYQFKTLGGRAVRMLKGGEWGRFARAVGRRLPLVSQLIKTN